MPFELGLAVSWSDINPSLHSWHVCDSERHRILRSASDLAGTDIHIHNGTIVGVMRELCNIFVRQPIRPDVPELMKLYRSLRDVIPDVQRKTGARTLFEPRVFADICYAVVDLRDAM